MDQLNEERSERAELIDLLRRIAEDGFAVILVPENDTHDESCWRQHPPCAILHAASLLDGWMELQCAEHDELFLTPDCPKCVSG